MPTVKLRNRNEWWTANTLQDIKNLSAKLSIETGELLVFDEVDELPGGLGAGDYSLLNVVIYKKATKLPNAEYQRRHRKMRRESGLRELRGIWVSADRYDKIKEEITNDYADIHR